MTRHSARDQSGRFRRTKPLPVTCTVTDEDGSSCIRPRVHTGDHHFLVPRRRPAQEDPPPRRPSPTRTRWQTDPHDHDQH